MAGVALATTISQGFSAVMVVIVLMKRTGTPGMAVDGKPVAGNVVALTDQQYVTVVVTL